MSEKLFGLKFRSSKGFFEDQVIKYIYIYIDGVSLFLLFSTPKIWESTIYS